MYKRKYVPHVYTFFFSVKTRDMNVKSKFLTHKNEKKKKGGTDIKNNFTKFIL